MRHDEDSTAQRVSHILDQVRRTEPPVEDDVWPQEWPPGTSDRPDPGDDPQTGRLRFGPRRQIPVPAAAAAAVLALLVVAVVAVLLLRGPSPGTSVPDRAPVPLGGVPTGLTGASAPGAGTEPAIAASVAAGGSTDAPPGALGLAGSGSASAGQFRVYVVGQVRRPGVVTLSVGARVEDAVQAVGGATEKADLAVMNLARKVVDGERIVVPKPGEKVPTADPVAAAEAGGSGAAGGDAAAGGTVPGTPVDLNTATVAQLDALPGVGPVIAGRIVAWRQENGRFTTVDDLSEVQGIGDATMARLRPLVRV